MDETVRTTAAQLADGLAGPVADAAARLAPLIPESPAATIGWLGDSREPPPAEPAWRGLTFSPVQRDSPELMLPMHRVGALPSPVAHRVLGAVEEALRDLPVAVPDATGRRLGAAATAGREEHVERFGLTDIQERFTAFGVPTQLAGLRAPAAEDLVVALVHALAGTAPVAAALETGAGPIPEMAASHGRRHAAVALAVSAVVLRAAARAVEPACPDGPEAVVGVALEAVTRLLAERPMPRAWADARQREHRAGYLLPQATAVRLQARDGRYALVEGPDLPAAGSGRATSVPGGIVVRTGVPDASVELTVEVTGEAPGPPGDRVRDWDEVVELGYTAATGAAGIVASPGTIWPDWEFGLAFPWPGPVRVRVHARVLDDGAEHHLLHLWEADPTPETVYRSHDPDRLHLPWVGADIPVIVRTAFDDDAAFEAVRSALLAGWDGTAVFDVVDDARFDGLTVDRLVELAGPGWSDTHGYLYVVDRTTLTEPVSPVLVVGLPAGERGRSFRVVPTSVRDVVANLSLANMSFDGYADWAAGGILDTSS